MCLLPYYCCLLLVVCLCVFFVVQVVKFKVTTGGRKNSAGKTTQRRDGKTSTGCMFFFVQELTKKVLRETQTLRAGCSKAEPKIFAPPQTPFPGAHDGQNLISWRWSLLSPTDPFWWGSMNAISSYHGKTHKQTNKPTHKQTGPITIHCATKLSKQC